MTGVPKPHWLRIAAYFKITEAEAYNLLAQRGFRWADKRWFA